MVSKANAFLWIAFAVQAALVIIALLLGFPAVNVDEVFYVAPGIDLHRYGTLTSSMAMPEVKPFFSYPPYYAFVLAAWFLVVNVSSETIATLQAVAVLGFSFAVFLAIPRQYRSLTAAASIAVVSLFSIGNLGFRPDAVALWSLAGGALLITRAGRISRTTGFFLLIASGLIAPGTLAYVVATVVSILAYRFLTSRKEMAVDIGLLAGAGLLNGLIFSLMIGWQYTLFAQMFFYRVSESGHGQGSNVILVLRQLFSYWIGMAVRLPIVIALLGLGVVMLRPTTRAPREVVWALATLFGALVLNLVVSTSSTPTWLSMFLWLGLIVAMSVVSMPRLLRYGAFVGFAGLFPASVSSILIPALAQSKPAPDYFAKTWQDASAIKAQLYVADAVAFRKMFDYNPPPGVVNWESQWYYPVPGTGKSRGIQVGQPLQSPAQTERGVREVQLISRHTIKLVLPQYANDLRSLEWKGRRFRWAVEDPLTFDIFIVP